MTPTPSPLVRHLDDLPVERWDDPQRGNTTWRTLYSAPDTPTNRLATGVATVPSGGELTRHRHETVETYFVISGTGRLTLGDNRYDMRPGSSVLIPSLTPHGILNTGLVQLEFYYAFAADSFADVHYEFTEL